MSDPTLRDVANRFDLPVFDGLSEEAKILIVKEAVCELSMMFVSASAEDVECKWAAFLFQFLQAACEGKRDDGDMSQTV